MSIGTKEQEARRIAWRRAKIIELNAKGISSQTEISKILQISEGTISRDVHYLKQESKQLIQSYIEDKLPYEYRKVMESLEIILRRAFDISEEEGRDTREALQALSLAKDCNSMKLGLLTNANVIEDAIRFADKFKRQGQLPNYGDKKKGNGGSSDKDNNDNDASIIVNSNDNRQEEQIQQQEEQYEDKEDKAEVEPKLS